MRKGRQTDTEYYDILELPPTAQPNDINTSYRRLARKWHPDKWGNFSPEEKKTAEDNFKKISHAYSVLSDPDKKQHYDNFGKDDDGDIGARDDFFRNIFSGAFFGNMGPRHPQKNEPKMPDIIKKVEISLDQLYTGHVVEIVFERYNLKPNMSHDNLFKSCDNCKGSGFISRVIQRNHSILQQINENCDRCSGQGYTVETSVFDTETKTISHKIPRGTLNGESLIIANEGHENPPNISTKLNAPRSNLIIVINSSDTFKIDGSEYHRDNKDPSKLHISVTLEAHEAICGTLKTLTFLTSEKFNLKIPSNILFEESHIVIVPKLGMPIPGKKKRYGDLVVSLDIQRPNLTQDLKSKIWELFTNQSMDSYIKSTLKKAKGDYIDAITCDEYEKMFSPDYDDTENCQQDQGVTCQHQ